MTGQARHLGAHCAFARVIPTCRAELPDMGPDRQLFVAELFGDFLGDPIIGDFFKGYFSIGELTCQLQ